VKGMAASVRSSLAWSPNTLRIVGRRCSAKRVTRVLTAPAIQSRLSSSLGLISGPQRSPPRPCPCSEYAQASRYRPRGLARVHLRDRWLTPGSTHPQSVLDLVRLRA